MSEHTKACLDMAPQVAEIMGPWEPKEGDWYIPPKVNRNREPHLYMEREDITGYVISYRRHMTWLPTLEQCLDWLRGRLPKYDFYFESDPTAPHLWWVYLTTDATFGKDSPQIGDTLLEAVYRAVIAVGESAQSRKGE